MTARAIPEHVAGNLTIGAQSAFEFRRCLSLWLLLPCIMGPEYVLMNTA